MVTKEVVWPVRVNWLRANECDLATLSAHVHARTGIGLCVVCVLCVCTQRGGMENFLARRRGDLSWSEFFLGMCYGGMVVMVP